MGANGRRRGQLETLSEFITENPNCCTDQTFFRNDLLFPATTENLTFDLLCEAQVAKHLDRCITPGFTMKVLAKVPHCSEKVLSRKKL